MEKIKDFFHNFSDIFFAIIIAGIMFAVLTLNLGSWFNDSSNTVLADKPINTSKDQNNNTIHNNNVNIEDEDNQSETEDNIDKTKIEKPQDNNDTDPNINENEQENEVVQETKKIVIPNGTVGTGVANILKENGLIDDANDFVQAAESLKLSSRLKSGSFKIPTNTTVENMVKIIAGQKNM